MNSQLSDQLEPYWEHLDGLIEEDIKKTVSSANYKYFDACRFKIKALWYIHSRVGDLDARYGQLIDEFIARREYERFSHNQDGTWSYFPFFESLEFENLLNQGKACLDCFSKAVGSAFGELPNNLSKLETVLKTKAKSHSNAQSAKLLLHKISNAKSHLEGIVLDPGKGKKSIRDLISHRLHAPITFRISESKRSPNALLKSDHPEITLFSNYRVVEISERVWYHTKKLVEESLPHLLKRN